MPVEPAGSGDVVVIDSPVVMASVNVVLPEMPKKSVTVTVKVYTPANVGIPVSPPSERSASPVGSVPLVNDHA